MNPLSHLYTQYILKFIGVYIYIYIYLFYEEEMQEHPNVHLRTLYKINRLKTVEVESLPKNVS